MRSSIDQIGDVIEYEEIDQRIISIVPSQTELLYELGLEDKVVGITKFCIHPKTWFKNKSRVGGTKDVDLKKVLALNPTLIIGNKEENLKENIEDLRKEAPVWMSDIYTLDDSLDMIYRVTDLTNTQTEGIRIINTIKKEFRTISKELAGKSVLYFIWRKPFMGVAKNTFVNHVLSDHLGMVNVLKDEERYPLVEFDKIDEPDFIFLSSEPYPFKEKHFAEIQRHFPKSKIVLVDGEYFSWYGSRLMNAPKYFNQLITSLVD